MFFVLQTKTKSEKIVIPLYYIFQKICNEVHDYSKSIYPLHCILSQNRYEPRAFKTRNQLAVYIQLNLQ